MLYEVKNVKQNENEPKRRWFVSDYFDLVVWIDENGAVEGFQLCYDKAKNQHALTWHKELGYMHNRVDDGEDKPGKPKSIPILVVNGYFSHEQIAEIFKQESQQLEKKISDLIYEKILQYSTSDFKKTSDNLAMKQAALDYIEGWYEGNAKRVEKSLHPEMNKKVIFIDPTGEISLQQMSALSLLKTIQVSEEEKQQINIEILDVSQNIANVKIETSDNIEYIYIARVNEKWLIVNILSESKSQPV